jgi:chromosome segregation protein
MKIKKLEMVGFKSFVDRTVVNFDHEVLGIVGPNGCGKSNIVDAIRWCMGEQSARHLRGRSMEDVLFSGSESRQGTDFAEVTLTFDNDDGHDLPIEYRDYPEIAVTRRLHRSGESEYLINKTTVRLKDVTDLFLGTGAGTKAYSIVEQGKIGLITTAKPEDRRLLIEEAAGITKFKSKKKQAERKMELTQQNLLRVSDIVAEIERSIGSLKRQAAKAERYVSYKRELEDLQLYEASHKYLELAGWIKLETSEVAEWTAESDAKRSGLVAREAELETVRLDGHAADEALEKAHNASFAAENEVRGEEAAIARAKDKIDALRKREEQAGAELLEIDTAHARLEREREVVCDEVVALEAEDSAQAAELATEEARLAEVTDESSRADAKVNELRQAIAKAGAEIASAEAKLTGFERRKGEMQARVEKMRAERESLEGAQIEHAARGCELEQAVTDLREGRITSAEEKQHHEERLAELRREISESERLLDEAKSELSRKRSRLHALDEMRARLEGIGAGVKALIGTKDPALCGFVADRMEAPAELTQALAGLLGSRLQDVVVSDLARGEALLESLAAGKKGRATIVPLHPPHVAGSAAVLPSIEGIVGRLVDRLRFAPEDGALVHALVGDAIVTHDLAAARALRGEAPQTTVVTLDGTVLRPDGRVSGGTGEEVAAGMLSSNREMRELGEEVQRLDALVTERLARHQTLRHSLGETQGALERARQQAHRDELSLVTAERDLRASQQQLESTRKRLETLCAEIEDLSALLLEAGHERDEAQRVLDEARAVLEERQMGLGDAEAVSASWREQLAERRHVVTERKVQRAGAREKLTAATGTLQRLARSTEELGERARRLNEELYAGARAMGETAALVVLHKERLQQALDTQHVAADALAEARGVSDRFRADMGEREATIKGLRHDADAARESLTLHEMALRERSLAMEHLVGGVAERFRGLRLARVVGDYHMRPPPDEESHGRIAELVQLLDRMGSVNLDAVREHEEAEKRYNFYTTQKADLDKALADLERAIQQMNRESKKLFADTFEAVNIKFQEIFPKMFRGGRASLRLTNPEDMLETGIDILAQPPGKKISSIELMSGGEKALTAVSLIFAIFQVKPSPFCILDEVDAPLDEANVDRYNEIVREMTDRSQFIVITHNKRTMESADHLYGVTMQEPGVSKLVSVNLSKLGPRGAAPPPPARTGGASDVASV